MREKMIDLAHDYFDSVPWYADIADLNPEELIDHLIANDVVPVVRCKDCNNTCPGHNGLVCVIWGAGTEPNAFCSRGERIE